MSLRSLMALAALLLVSGIGLAIWSALTPAAECPAVGLGDCLNHAQQRLVMAAGAAALLVIGLGLVVTVLRRR